VIVRCRWEWVAIAALAIITSAQAQDKATILAALQQNKDRLQSQTFFSTEAPNKLSYHWIRKGENDRGQEGS